MYRTSGRLRRTDPRGAARLLKALFLLMVLAGSCATIWYFVRRQTTSPSPNLYLPPSSGTPSSTAPPPSSGSPSSTPAAPPPSSSAPAPPPTFPVDPESKCKLARALSARCWYRVCSPATPEKLDRHQLRTVPAHSELYSNSLLR